MKIIIDISEDVYTRLFNNGIQDNEIAVDDVCEMAKALRIGTPLSAEPCEDYISRNDVIKMLNTMDRYTADKLKLCDTDKEFPHNEVFIVDDVYEELDLLPSAENKTDLQSAYDCGYNQACKDKIVSPYKAERGE